MTYKDAENKKVEIVMPIPRNTALMQAKRSKRAAAVSLLNTTRAKATFASLLDILAMSGLRALSQSPPSGPYQQRSLCALLSVARPLSYQGGFRLYLRLQLAGK